MPKSKPVVPGERHNRLVVLKEILPLRFHSGIKRRCKAKCDCGTVAVFRLHYIRNGHTKSCGCLHREGRKPIHGLASHPITSAWKNMLRRCYNEDNASYPDYGGRGITVCKEWRRKKDYAGLLAFHKWNESLPADKRWKKGLQLDRKDNNKGYDPSNCKWSTSKQNIRNTRLTLRCIWRGIEMAFADFYDLEPRDISYQQAAANFRKGKPLKKCVARQYARPLGVN